MVEDGAVGDDERIARPQQAAQRRGEIGAVARPVSTRNPEAQLWFDRGLALCFGFNHEEAVVAFRRAAELDPALAMAHWGEAYALAPNCNSPVLSEEADSLDTFQFSSKNPAALIVPGLNASGSLSSPMIAQSGNFGVC